MDKKSLVIKRMFDQITPTYDFLNHLLSAGFDIYWRNKFVKSVLKKVKNGGRRIKILDLASGTGDVIVCAIEYLTRKYGVKTVSENFIFYAADFSEPMLLVAKSKLFKKYGHLKENFHFIIMDACNPCFKDNGFDIVLTSFGLRNFQPVEAFLDGARRYIKPGGNLAILEFVNILQYEYLRIFEGYYRTILKAVGRLFSGHGHAYSYLASSIMSFKTEGELLNLIGSRGFHVTDRAKLFPYVAAQYVAILDKTS